MNKAIVDKMKDLYSLLEPVSFIKIDKGFLSENYKVSTNGTSFFLKRYRFQDKEKIQEIHSVKKYFSEREIPVIMPLPTNEGETFFEYEDSFFSLFPFVSGFQPERSQLSDTMISSLGRTLGRMHLLGMDCPIKTIDVFHGWDQKISFRIIDLIQAKLDAIENKSDFDRLAQRTIDLKKKLIQINGVEFADLNLKSDHLVHGDYLDQNVFFDDEGNVKYVFDFEKTNIQPRTRELFRSATYSFLNTNFDEVSIQNIRLYIKAYREIYPITDKELDNGLKLHYIDSINGFWVEIEHYIKNNMRADSFLELNYKRLKYMSERLDDFLK